LAHRGFFRGTIQEGHDNALEYLPDDGANGDSPFFVLRFRD